MKTIIIIASVFIFFMMAITWGERAQENKRHSCAVRCIPHSVAMCHETQPICTDDTGRKWLAP